MNFLPGFTAGLLLITLSELGDKTFFISAILAMRHPRRWVFLGATCALLLMTILSVLLGQVATLLPQNLVHAIAVALFFGFGFKLLYDASRVPASVTLAAEQVEALEVVERREQSTTYEASAIGVMLEAFSLTFVAEWGDRTQLATLTLATTYPPIAVIMGATLGHTICAAIAVLCGKFIAGRISERWLLLLGGVLFLLFGVLAAYKVL